MARCSTCGGSILAELDSETNKTRYVCMSCGREAEAPMQEPTNHNGDWKKYALGHLNDLIKQVQDTESIKLEAEHTAAALRAAAVTNVPELPWKTTKKPMGRPRKNTEVAA
jgi:DNA-directed RNA polymerase subunit RPC12/RpoP